MPCDSRITVQIEDMERLADAFRALGYKITQQTENFVKGSNGVNTLVISKRNAVGNRAAISEVARKYAEIGVRRYAKRKGYAVTESDGTRMTLTSRRGG